MEVVGGGKVRAMSAESMTPQAPLALPESEVPPAVGELVSVVEFDVAAVCKEWGPPIKSRKLERMVAAYVGVARGDATNACRAAGYSWAEKAGYRLRKKYKRVFDLADEALRNQLVMGPVEWDRSVTSIARDPVHKDRLKALELWGKVIGRVSDHIDIRVDRPGLNSELVELVKMLVTSKHKQLHPAVVDVKPLRIGPKSASTR
jgi:hypothetical protein